MRLPNVGVSLEVIQCLQELHPNLQYPSVRDARDFAPKRTHRVGAELVEEVDSRFADGLLLVEETEAQRLQAVEMRREPR